MGHRTAEQRVRETRQMGATAAQYVAYQKAVDELKDVDDGTRATAEGIGRIDGRPPATTARDDVSATEKAREEGYQMQKAGQ